MCRLLPSVFLEFFLSLMPVESSDEKPVSSFSLLAESEKEGLLHKEALQGAFLPHESTSRSNVGLFHATSAKSRPPFMHFFAQQAVPIP